MTSGLPVRGEIRAVDHASAPSRLAVVVGRPALAARSGRVACVPLRVPPHGLPSEVAAAAAADVLAGAVVAADEPFVAPLEALGEVRGQLGPIDLELLDGALRYALDIPGPIPGRLPALQALAAAG